MSDLLRAPSVFLPSAERIRRAPRPVRAWALLVVFAVIPPLVVMRYWRAPVQTTSQSIQEVLR